MKTSTASNTLVVARVGLAIAAFNLASCAADDLTSDQQRAALAQSAPPVSTLSGGDEQPCTGHQSHALFLEDANGKPFRLVHVRGCGWKQVADEETQEINLTPPQMSFAPIAASQAEATPATTGDPLAVFIDGPTGYTFAWTAEGGWKFVGYLSDGTR